MARKFIPLHPQEERVCYNISPVWIPMPAPGGLLIKSEAAVEGHGCVGARHSAFLTISQGTAVVLIYEPIVGAKMCGTQVGFNCWHFCWGHDHCSYPINAVSSQSSYAGTLVSVVALRK